MVNELVEGFNHKFILMDVKLNTMNKS
ncbi:uncharacterized protein METZ01_LOCUS316196 [marine metagenome]|uniref:Uncharacterized protein n=1 Tax=marine metagenome TaxID=408172 RepID=A0A382NUG6_9ZZZZ